MNIIKGLILKDLLQLKSYKRTLIVYILIFILTGFAQETTKGIGVMVAVMLTLGFGMFSMASFNYDEQAKSDGYFLTFPLTKKNILLAKYILVIISTIVGAIVGVLASILIIYFIDKQFPNINDILYTILGGIFGVGLIEAIQIPCVYKWGAEKGRIQMFIVAALIVVLALGVLSFVSDLNISISANKIENFIPIILTLLIILIYYISYKVSYKIYKNKEV